MIGALLLLTAIALLAYVFYRWATSNNDFFEKRNIKHVKPKFLFGSMLEILFRVTAVELGELGYVQFPGEAITGFFEFRSPKFVVRDPKIIKQICVKDFDHFMDHEAITTEAVDALLGNVLVFMRGEKWRHMRATLSPAFTGSKMRQMFGLVSQCADDIAQHLLRESANGQPVHVEMKDLFCRYTNDVIASCAFGIKIDSIAEPTNEFYMNGRKITDLASASLLLRFLLVNTAYSLAKLLNIGIIDKTIANNFRSIILNTMEERKKRNIFRPDMINILMQVRDGSLMHQTEAAPQQENGANEGFATAEEIDVRKTMFGNGVIQPWSDDELAAQCFLFFFAGFETASTLLSFATYELMLNPDVQQRLHEEIAEMNKSMGGKHITYDALQKMKYLDQVVCETLRKWPPFVNMDRVCTKPYRYSDDGVHFSLVENQVIILPIYGIQHDAQYFPEPDKFDPERFSDENKDNIVQGSYIPFGIGPRNCIGSRFALMEVKAILYYLLLSFSFERYEKTQVPLKLKRASFNLAAQDGLHLEFKPRTNLKKAE